MKHHWERLSSEIKISMMIKPKESSDALLFCARELFFFSFVILMTDQLSKGDDKNTYTLYLTT